MNRRVSARLSRASLLLLSMGYAVGALASDANLLPSSSDPRFRAVGQLDLLKGRTCTGSIVAGSASPDGHRPALLLTSGHCVFGPELIPNQVMIDEAAPAGYRFTPAYFQDAQPVHRPVGIERILYATTKNMDIAVLRLDVSYADLAALGVAPLVPSAPAIVGSLPVDLVQVPVTGVSEEDRFLRLATCQASEPVRLFEGERFFLRESATDCAGVSGGSSGSPVLRHGTSDIVGVLGTKVDPRFDGCGFDRPCELTGRQPVSRVGASYQSIAAPLLSALRADGGWDASALDAGNGVKLDRTVGEYTRSQIDEEGDLVPARWGVLVNDDTRWVRYKHGDAATVDCASPEGYSAPMYAREQPLDRLPVGPSEGVYAMCVIGQLGIDNDWQAPEHASVMLRVIDDTAPTAVPVPAVRDETDAAWIVEIRSPYVAPPIVKVGRLDSTDCADDAKYRTLSSSFISLPKAKGPLRVCAKGSDEAGNLSPVGSIDLVVSKAH
ncbi:trypsin-like peptidase domain-containing protein [Luteibacter sp. 9133]|uniref:trypsin-like peptidase domain-containing protein n=1 Tax=Luteibacter sp. 9133 TaxID=1500891 RepID=UPI0009E0960C|nr:trypsin-like peptidase domain-containing protein [Luteibacter sp. 9133]